jgi:hypothetical protein
MVPETADEKLTGVVLVPLHMDWLARLGITFGVGLTVTV